MFIASVQQPKRGAATSTQATMQHEKKLEHIRNEGGNIQKLILARVFEAAPKLILANQPTRGLDMGAAADVANRLLEARQRGSGVILISEDLDEILSLSDRIMVIYDGELKAVETHDRETIGLMMAGEAA